MEPGPIRARLALMMFGQYLILGAWAVPLASYLLEQPTTGGLGFTPGQTSWIYSTTAIAALLTPLIMGLLADRLFATQKLLGFLNILGAGLLFFTARFCSQQQLAIREAVDPAAEIQRTFTILMAFMFANSLVLILTLSLCNVTGFRNLREPKKSYGLIRLYGTVAWILINLAIDFFGEPMSAQPLFVAAIASLIVGLYSFTLPHTPPSRLGKGIGSAIGLPALKMFHKPSFRVLILCALCMAAIQQFYAVYANPYLRDLGAFKPMALQTMAQASEVVCLIFFPVVLMRYGFKVTLGIGILGWIIRNLLFATGWLPLIGVVGLPLHGMCYAFFFLVANVYVDRHAPLHLRASAQGIMTFTAAGIGTLLGNYLSGAVLESCVSNGSIDWAWFWLVPAAGASVVLVFFVLFFQDDHHAVPESTKNDTPLSTAVSV